MASGFFALLDDISVLMDDVATMSKISAKKTAGILGDDLAVNAEKASGFVSSRELPVLWAITKGSFFNKLIILPFAFLLSAFLPSVITIILILGGLYLAYEGVEKIYDYFIPQHSKTVVDSSSESMSETAILALEQKKIKSAILTDFILSVEIIIIALGTVLDQSLTIQIAVVSIISSIATVGVYGAVALIVRMDDFGLKLIQKSKEQKNLLNYTGVALVNALPIVIKLLSVIGTVALLLVSGGIFSHNLETFHHLLGNFPEILRDLSFGLSAGLLTLLVVRLCKLIFKRSAKKA
jgi:predicted DNA repair protein MutK